MLKAIKEINILAQESKAKFISFKFIDSQGRLNQIDSLISSLNFKGNNIFIRDLTLAPIENKIFLDPLRSFPTIFCLCENLTTSYSRILFKEVLETPDLQNLVFECAIEFTALNKVNIPVETNPINHDRYDFAVEPSDKLANLRSEIILALYDAGITPMYHYAMSPFQSVISFKSKNLLELADDYILTKYMIANIAESYGKSTDFEVSTNNQALASTITLSSPDRIFTEELNDIIKNSFKDKLAFLKLGILKHPRFDNNLQNKLVIGFDNYKINPYIVFSFLNPNNYKNDRLVTDKFNKHEIQAYIKSLTI